MAPFSQALFEVICRRIAKGELPVVICREADMPRRADLSLWAQSSARTAEAYALALAGRTSPSFKRQLLVNVAPRPKLIALNDLGRRIGEHHHMAKLTDEEVEQIRCKHEAGTHGYRRLASEYGVSKRTVRDIVSLMKRAQWVDRWKKI